VEAEVAEAEGVPVCVTAETELTGKDLVVKVIDPEIDKFERWFRTQEGAGTGLILMERDVLRSYLYQKIRGTL
jgi:hypothetical protein